MLVPYSFHKWTFPHGLDVLLERSLKFTGAVDPSVVVRRSVKSFVFESHFRDDKTKDEPPQLAISAQLYQRANTIVLGW